MVFYAGRIIREPAMANPTIVVLTDCNDLDDQLFGTCSRCSDLLRQPPQQAQSRAGLRELLDTASGGVVFTTIQKFFPAGHKQPPTSTAGYERPPTSTAGYERPPTSTAGHKQPPTSTAGHKQPPTGAVRAS